MHWNVALDALLDLQHLYAYRTAGLTTAKCWTGTTNATNYTF